MARGTGKGEEGITLVMGLILIAVLAVLGAAAVTMVTNEMKIGSAYKEAEQALYVAQAGVQEAFYRLGLFNDPTQAPPAGSRIAVNGLANDNAAISFDPNGLMKNNADDDGNGEVDDVGDLNYNGTYDNRDWTVRIMLNTSESGYLDTTSLIHTVTLQPSGSWLSYSSATVDGTELHITYSLDERDMDGDGNTREIVFYDPARSPSLHVETAAQRASGLPVLVIHAVGRQGGATRRVRVHVIAQPVVINAKAALTVDVVPAMAGTSLVSGFNHAMATDFSEAPNNEGDWIASASFKTNGVDNHGGNEHYSYSGINVNHVDITAALLPATPAPDNEEELATEAVIPYGNRVLSSGHLPGICCKIEGIEPAGSAHVFGGDGVRPWKAESCTTYASLGDALGVDAGVAATILAHANVTMAQVDGSGRLLVPPTGLIYIDNAPSGVPFKISASTPGYDRGWGFMYVTGDVDFTNFCFKGMIYIDGDAKITGNFWVLGSVFVKGATTGDFLTNNGHFLYSKEVLSSLVPMAMGYRTLLWEESLDGV